MVLTIISNRNVDDNLKAAFLLLSHFLMSFSSLSFVCVSHRIMYYLMGCSEGCKKSDYGVLLLLSQQRRRSQQRRKTNKGRRACRGRRTCKEGRICTDG